MQPTSDPNVIPFIDIMLVLLIIFMVAAPIPTVDVRVDLPPPNPTPIRIEGLRPTFVVLEDEGGQLVITVDGEVTTREALGAKVLDKAIINNPALNIRDIYSEARIFLRADQETAYGNVIGVMSRLQEEGFVKVGIVAEEAQF
ncbi:MAG: biopolymer transporter ExbD [Hyphomonadaceae bacterium]|jgi:biopolymer transport protein ExbD|nr:biopolymer transporter ExbD [Hyphomonadaceae bacterium]